MKIIDRITESLGLYDEEEIFDDEADAVESKADKADKKSRFSGLFSKKNQQGNNDPVMVERPEQPAPKAEAPKAAAARPSLFTSKNKAGAKNNKAMGSRTIALPLADKQVKVVVLEPSGFDDSQKIADYLRNNQPVVVNFEGTDNVVTKRMTDFISGTIYALGGSMKKIGRSILVCAPKNVDIDAGVSVYDEKGGQPWNQK